jgi:hypothetical protein
MPRLYDVAPLGRRTALSLLHGSRRQVIEPFDRIPEDFGFLLALGELLAPGVREVDPARPKMTRCREVRSQPALSISLPVLWCAIARKRKSFSELDKIG